MIRLTIECKGAQEEVTFDDEEVITIGRSSKNNLQVPDKRASRKHCLIEKGETSYRIVDLASKNGTTLNGKKIDACDIQKGDTIATGEATLYVNEVILSSVSKEAVPAVPKVVPQRTRVGAGGIKIRRGPREMPMGLLDYILVIIIFGLIVYAGGVIVFVLKGKNSAGNPTPVIRTLYDE